MRDRGCESSEHIALDRTSSHAHAVARLDPKNYWRRKPRHGVRLRPVRLAGVAGFLLFHSPANRHTDAAHPRDILPPTCVGAAAVVTG